MRGKLLGMIAGTALLLLGGCEGITGDRKPKLGDVYVAFDENNDSISTTDEDGGYFVMPIGTRLEFLRESKDGYIRLRALDGEKKDTVFKINPTFLRPAP